MADLITIIAYAVQSDYEDIDSRYGSLADVDELIAELKSREMKLVVGLFELI